MLHFNILRRIGKEVFRKEGADLVILNRSPLETDKLLIKDICVLSTIKDGETIYKKQ